MPVSNPYYRGVKVKKLAVKAVKDIVEQGFYQQDSETQWEWLKALSARICDGYNIHPPKLVKSDSEVYNSRQQTIGLPKTHSIISLLHELRHHIQHQANKRYKDHNVEEDARAWSLRVFKLACPGSFKRSVFNGKVKHIIWEGDKIVNSRGY